MKAALRLQKGARATFEHQTGQVAGGVGAGIDADPVRADVGLGGHTVPVHDDLAVVERREEKLLSDPNEVRRGLTIQGNTGPDSGMDEEVVALRMRQLQRLEEVELPRAERPC